MESKFADRGRKNRHLVESAPEDRCGSVPTPIQCHPLTRELPTRLRPDGGLRHLLPGVTARRTKRGPTVVAKDIWDVEVLMQEAEPRGGRECGKGSTATGAVLRTCELPSTDDSDSSTVRSTYAHRCMVEKHQVEDTKGIDMIVYVTFQHT